MLWILSETLLGLNDCDTEVLVFPREGYTPFSSCYLNFPVFDVTHEVSYDRSNIWMIYWSMLSLSA